MIKLVVTWSRPADEVAFEAYYHDAHLPLARKCPGVRAIESLHMNKGDIYRIALLSYDSTAELRSSLDSREGRAVIADVESMQKRFKVTSTSHVGRPDD
jgi:uncharacterized protein (TIGR02118 family)